MHVSPKAVSSPVSPLLGPHGGVFLPNVRLVLETLEPLSGDRKCFRMINGVLTERTVKEVVPILKTNSEGLKKTLDSTLR